MLGVDDGCTVGGGITGRVGDTAEGAPDVVSVSAP